MSRKPTSLEALMAGQRLDAADNVVAFVRPPKTVEKLTVYLPRAAAKRLKQMALDNDRRVNDLLQEGVDLMLAKYGQPSLKEFGE
jgi:hypothetical protein